MGERRLAAAIGHVVADAVLADDPAGNSGISPCRLAEVALMIKS